MPSVRPPRLRQLWPFTAHNPLHVHLQVFEADMANELLDNNPVKR